jgi:hypothetical protein
MVEGNLYIIPHMKSDVTLGHSDTLYIPARLQCPATVPEAPEDFVQPDYMASRRQEGAGTLSEATANPDADRYASLQPELRRGRH